MQDPTNFPAMAKCNVHGKVDIPYQILAAHKAASWEEFEGQK